VINIIYIVVILTGINSYIKTGSSGPNFGGRSPGLGCTFEQQGMLRFKYGTDTVLLVPDILKQVSSVSYKTLKMSVVHYVLGHVFMFLRYIIRFQCLY